MEHYSVAKKIVLTLRNRGFVAYFAGGWVRDFILGKEGDDIDIATNADPLTIAEIFEKTIPVGIAFGSVIVVEKGLNFEVTTFRKDSDYKDKRRPSKVIYSGEMDDALRRDFTINGMFYDPIDKKVLDYVDGRKDLQAKIIRAIGDPDERLEEDRLRTIRAVRLAGRLSFKIEENTKRSIKRFSSDIMHYVSVERITQELTKICEQDNSKEGFTLLWDLNLFSEIFYDITFDSKASFLRRVYFLNCIPSKQFVVYLLEIYAYPSIAYIESLCDRFKLSNKQRDLAIFLKRSQVLHRYGGSDIEWISFYAHERSMLSEETHLLHVHQKRRRNISKQHIDRRKRLRAFINLKKQNRYPILAKDLMDLGVLPGKLLGFYLKKSWIIAVANKTLNKNKILKILMS